MTASLHVNKKDNKYYIHLNWKQNGNRKQKCIGTGLTDNGRNKRKAEQMLKETLTEWESKIVEDKPDTLFSEYLAVWLEDIKHTVQKSTFSNYRSVVNGVIRPYFEELEVMLTELTPRHILNFYNYKMEHDGISPNTIHHYHSYINGALKHAIDMEMLKSNPAEKVKLPQKVKHKAVAHEGSVLAQLIRGAYNTPLEVPIRIASMFGARRGEVLGLKWKNVDLEKRKLSIENVIAKADGEFFKETPKNNSSVREFPLSDSDVEFFKRIRGRQQFNKYHKKNRYYYKDEEFVCVDDNGHRLKLDYVSRAIPRLAEQLGLDRVKMHELRHSNISILIDAGATIKEAQEWAGHSTPTTTTTIYAHAMGKYKARLAETIENSLNEAMAG